MPAGSPNPETSTSRDVLRMRPPNVMLFTLLTAVGAFSPSALLPLSGARAPLPRSVGCVMVQQQPLVPFHAGGEAFEHAKSQDRRTSGLAMRQIGPGGFGGGFRPGDLVLPVIFVSLVASGALGWIFNGLLFLSLIPLIGGPLFSWYISNNLLEGSCPECGVPVQVLKGQTGQCFSCGATCSSELQNGVFMRDGPQGVGGGGFGAGGFGGFGGNQRDDGVVEVEVITDDDTDGPRRW
jgi:hypothetical protein